MAEEWNIIYGPEEDFSIPKKCMGTYLFELLQKRNFDDVVYEDAFSNESVTAGYLLKYSIKLAIVFKALNLKKDDVVCIISENNVNYFSIILAGLYTGVIVNPLNPEYTKGEYEHIFEITKPQLIICSESALPSLQKVYTTNFSAKFVLLNSSETYENFPSIQKFVESIPAETLFVPSEFDYSSQLALVLLSSGTTGLPKGVSYTHQNIRALATIIRNLYLEAKSDCVIQFVPSFHVYGIMLLTGAIINQTKVIIMPKFKTDVFLKCIEQNRVETIFAVPQILQFLATTNLLTQYNISSVKYIFSGAANISKCVLNSLQQRLDAVTVLQLYGLTETSGPCVYQRTSLVKLCSVGSLIAGCNAKVCCPKTHEAFGPFKVGEICFKGNFNMKGYFNNDDATKQCIDDNGFLHTGDLGYYDEDNCFFIVDRLKDIIKYKGFQVSPAELENIILQHPCVKECGVIGIPDERAGELPMAFVVSRPEESVSEKDIVEFVGERISAQKRLYGGVRFIDSLPKTSTGKIQRRKLQRMFIT